MSVATPAATPAATADDNMNAVLDITGDSGLIKKILVKGSDTIPRGVTAIIHYTGKLSDGTIFDSSVQRNVPFSFKIGIREVILAWELGVATMKKGEKCIFTCEPEYAYGKVQVGPIPPNEKVTYEVELLGWEGQTKESVALLPLVTMSVFLGLLACVVGSFFYEQLM